MRRLPHEAQQARDEEDCFWHEGHEEENRVSHGRVAASVGSRGDSYDNALVESFNGLYRTDVIRTYGPWRGLGDVESAPLVPRERPVAL